MSVVSDTVVLDQFCNDDLIEAAKTKRNKSWSHNVLIPSWVEVEDVPLDRFFTRPEVAAFCYENLREVMAKDWVWPDEYTFVEPGVGGGVL